MRLVASLIVRNELGRYLDLVVDHLLEFCDAIAVMDDASDDGTTEWLRERMGPRFSVDWRLASFDAYGEPKESESLFYVHEGFARQWLLDKTLERHAPTHVLAIDADEFVADGRALRAALEDRRGACWSLVMQEVWCADEDGLCVREDGGWREHPVACLWKVPPGGAPLTIEQRPLACGRTPTAIRQMEARALDSGTEVLHFGWARRSEREARHARYVEHDGGRFHARAHLDSILWEDERVELRQRPWPESLPATEIAARAA